MQKERCFESCLKENEERRHFKPRPLPLGRAPEGFYPGSDYNDLESSTRVVSQQKQQRQAWKTLNQVQGDDLVCYNNNAFTLIELLVVVLIIGILAAVAVPQYQVAVMKSRYATLKNITKSLADAEETYYLANGSYTEDMEALAVEPLGCQMTLTKRECSGSWGVCSLRAGSTSEHSVQCSRTGMQYMIYLDHSPALPKARICVARNRDLSSVENKICKAETGAVTPGTGTVNSYTWTYQ